jgi:hypothetical protein
MQCGAESVAPPQRSPIVRKWVLVIALGSWVAGGACGVATPAVDDGARAVVLADLHSTVSQGRFLITPRWSPAGDRLLMSGWHGVGLHSLDIDHGAIADLDWPSRARARWDDQGRVAPEAPRLEGSSEVLFDRDGIRILHRVRDGAIEAISTLGSRQLAAGGAWGVRVSPDGKLVAYCMGHLPSGRIRVVDLAGTELFEGPGVHGAWSPDMTELYYSVPEKRVSARGIAELGASDLYVVAAADWTPIRLTATPDVQEMEPAISPQGDRIAFSDWKTGTLTVARIARKGGAQ